MIEYMQFKEEYNVEVQKLIYSIMEMELKINKEQISSITKDLENIKSYYINSGGNFWLAINKENSELVGTVGIRKIDEINAEFKRFYVKENYRDKHIGHELYKIAEKFAIDNNFKTLYLVSGNKSEKACKMYYKKGWKLASKENKNVFVRKGANLYIKDI